MSNKEKLDKETRQCVFIMYLVATGIMLKSILMPYNDWCDYNRNMMEYETFVNNLFQYFTGIIISVMMMFFARNMNRRKLFVKSTANIIGILGIIILLKEIIRDVTGIILSANLGMNCNSMLEVSVGTVLIMISYMFRIGIKMREENELTI